MSAQAVGVVVEHNPIGIIIPRHWGIGKDGSLTGYGGAFAEGMAAEGGTRREKIGL